MCPISRGNIHSQEKSKIKENTKGRENKQNKILNQLDNYCSTEHVRVLSRVVCMRRQLTFEILRDNSYKIGMNSTVNKLYHINKQISLDSLNKNFVHYKKIMKFQFLKYGKTQCPVYVLLDVLYSVTCVT